MKRHIIKIIIVGILYCCSTSLHSQSKIAGIKSDYDLYSAGIIGAGENSEETACYWKNDVRHNLSPSKSRVSALFIDGKDVYISGHYKQKDGKMKPCYWKNGNFINLEINDIAYTSDIFVIGNDVYVTGYYKVSNGTTIPCYWMNGVKKDLEVQDNGSGYAKSITVKDQELFIAGFLSYSMKDELRYDACYWKNGKLIHLDSSPYKYSVVSEICTDNGEIYIAGRLDDTEKECLSIWKGETRYDYLTVPNKYSDNGSFFISWEVADYNSFSYDKGITNHKILINSIGIFNGDIYIVGEQDNRPCYWINNKITELANDGGDITLGGIAVIDQNILIGGKNKESICVWKNGVKKEIVKLNKSERPYKYGFMKY